VPSSARITPFTRGLVPRQDPNNGMAILAILGVPLPVDAPNCCTQLLGQVLSFPGASQPAPDDQRTMAQIALLERRRYLPP
jgi:hypothetical protein